MAALAGICLAVFPYAAPVKAERVPIRPGGIAVKMKLLGVVAACALALTAGAANADTFTISGTFGPGIITVCHLSGCDKIQAADAPLSGTVTIASGVLTNINLTHFHEESSPSCDLSHIRGAARPIRYPQFQFGRQCLRHVKGGQGSNERETTLCNADGSGLSLSNYSSSNICRIREN